MTVKPIARAATACSVMGVESTLERAATVPALPATPAWNRALRDPRWALGSTLAVARARYDLRRCDLVGRRTRLYGRCLVRNWGRIEIGGRVLIYGHTVRSELNAHAGGLLRIGDGAFLNYGCAVSAHTEVWIGEGALIGQYSLIMDCDYHGQEGGGAHGRPAAIAIGPHSWLGARVIVLKGMTIGACAIVGAGSVVTRDVPPRTLAGGSPARVIRQLD